MTKTELENFRAWYGRWKTSTIDKLVGGSPSDGYAYWTCSRAKCIAWNELKRFIKQIKIISSGSTQVFVTAGIVTHQHKGKSEKYFRVDTKAHVYECPLSLLEAGV